jgi:hypothetical protein
MATVEFNFAGLHPVFKEAIARHEPSVVFPLTNGRGRFVFMLFIPTDKDGRIVFKKLELFIILGISQNILKLKLYGDPQIKGDFRVWFDGDDVNAIKSELGLNADSPHDGKPFVFADFLANLNAAIPASISLRDKIQLIQENSTMIRDHCARYVDDASKVYLLGPKPLPKNENGVPIKRPREETLRKLNVYMTTVKPDELASLIVWLKELNWTMAWTDKKPNSGGSDNDKFTDLWTKVSAATKAKSTKK